MNGKYGLWNIDFYTSYCQTPKRKAMKVNQKFDPFKHRDLFFMFGLTVSLGLVFLAFQWNGPRLPEKVMDIPEVDLTSFIPVMVHTDEPEEVIVEKESVWEPEPDPQPSISTDVKVVDDKKVIVKTTTIRSVDLEPVKIKKIRIPVKNDKKEDNKVYDFTEIEPVFPGGVQAMYEWLSRNVSYPSFAIESNVEGTVYVSFVINKQGQVSDVQIIRGIGFGCDEEVTEAIKRMPLWNPGKQGGEAVNVRYKMPFTFKRK
jgi:protein TonB